MSHAVSALLLLAPWLLIERGPTRAWHWHAAGWMLGLGITVEFLAAPAAAICLAWAVAQRPPPRTLLALLAGCAIPVAGLLLHNALCFGGPFVASNFSAQSAQFRDARLALGVLDWPDLRRLYWLTIHPYRGLFYAAPVLLLPLASAFITRGTRARAGRHPRRARHHRQLPALQSQLQRLDGRLLRRPSLPGAGHAVALPVRVARPASGAPFRTRPRLRIGHVHVRGDVRGRDGARPQLGPTAGLRPDRAEPRRARRRRRRDQPAGLHVAQARRASCREPRRSAQFQRV